MSSPHISFCITTYKRGPVLLATLQSIQKQIFKNFEVIVTDNDTEESGRQFVNILNDERFKYYPNGKNLGMKPSFNRALSLSSGEYIVMMADDDPVYPDMLETLMALKEKHPGYGMYMGGCNWFCEDKDVANLYNLKIGSNSCLTNKFNLNHVELFTTSQFLKALFTFNIFSHFLWSTAIVKRSVLDNMGGIPDYGTAFLGDYAYMSIASTEKGVVIINRALGHQAMHHENFGRKQNDQLQVLTKKFPSYLQQKLSHVQDWPDIKQIIDRFFGIWITGHLAFIYRYNKANNIIDDSFNLAEKEVLKSRIVKKYRTKYFLKKYYPKLHDRIVKLKSVRKGKT